MFKQEFGHFVEAIFCSDSAQSANHAIAPKHKLSRYQFHLRRIQQRTCAPHDYSAKRILEILSELLKRLPRGIEHFRDTRR